MYRHHSDWHDIDVYEHDVDRPGDECFGFCVDLIAAKTKGTTKEVRIGRSRFRPARLILSEFLGICISTLGVMDSA